MTKSTRKRLCRNARTVVSYMTPMHAQRQRDRYGAFNYDTARQFVRAHPIDPLKAFDIYSSEIHWHLVAEKLNGMTA